MSVQKTVAVFGATGVQGSSVVRALAATGTYRIRAITRNPSSAAAKTLLAPVPNVTLHQANIDEPATLTPALADVTAIFAVTNFWEHLMSGSTRTVAGEKEFTQAMTIARAAAAVPTLEHLIWSTQPDVSALTAGKHRVPHCDFKGKADAAIKAELPALAAKTTFLIADFYPSNIVFMPPTHPHEVPGSHGGHVLLLPCGPETRVPHTGSMSSNFGVWVRQILANPERTRGKYLCARVGWITWSEMVAVWAEIGGKRVVAGKLAREVYEGLWGVAGEELASQFAWQEEATASAADYADVYKGLGLWVEPGEIGIEVDKMVGFKGALEELKALGMFS